MTLAGDITDGRGISNKMHREFLPKESKVMLYSKRHLNSCTLLTRWSALVLKVGVTKR